MKLFGFEITVQKAFGGLSTVYSGFTGAMGGILEPFAGAWQRNIIGDAKDNLLRFAPVYACVSLIAGDISKLRFKLMERDADGIWSEVLGNSPFWPVLRRPNEYQTPVQFLNQWLTSKLLWGNTYVYAKRDLRGIVDRMYVLDPRLVTPKITESGAVYYSLKNDTLSRVAEEIIVSADDVMHDRAMCPFHPLIGIPPIFAAALSASQGLRIQNNSAKFFENMSRPGGMLTAPDKISDETAKRLKAIVESAVGGENIGRILVAGDGLKFEPMAMPAIDAQLIEQWKLTAEDVARAFRVPLHKIGAGQDQKFANLAALNQDYYNQTLQELIEAIEAVLNWGLDLGKNDAGNTLAVELDLEGLLRMDPISRADRYEKLIRAAVMAPNEGRASEGLKPKTGGDTPYLQQQNFSIEALAKRDAREDPFATVPKAPATPALPAPTQEEPAAAAGKFLADLRDRFKAL